MIYTLTLSPSIDYTVHIEASDLKLGSILRSSYETMTPGGKGLNVSTVLSYFNAPTVALGIIGGKIGEIIEFKMKERNVKTDFIKINEESRINVKIPGEKETAINACGPQIDNSVIEELKTKIGRLTKEDWLVMSGSAPKSVSPDVYYQLAQVAIKNGAKVVVDTSGLAFKEAVKCKPFLVKPNLDELQEYYGQEIKNEKTMDEVCKGLLNLGVTNVLVSLGPKGACLYTCSGQKFSIPSKKTGNIVNTVGAGDSMLAAFIASYIKTNDLYESLKWSVATGTASVINHGTLPSFEDVQRLMKD